MFRRLREVFKNAQQVGRFKRLVDEISGVGSRRAAAVEELAELSAAQAGIQSVLKQYGFEGAAGPRKLVEFFWTLCKGGAGQLVGGTYVPTAALYDPVLIRGLLEIERASPEITRGTVEQMALLALQHVERMP